MLGCDAMRVFVSWSKPTSRKVAKALHEWLPQLINAVHPWMSAADLDAGKKWANEIERELATASVGILCVTPQNLTQPWLLFEAGAIAKQVSTTTRVIPYMFGVTDSDLVGPLTQFQGVAADKAGTFSLLESVNKALDPPEARTAKQLEKAFKVWWPSLKSALDEIAKEAKKDPEAAAPKRTDRELLEEILTLVRNPRAPRRTGFIPAGESVDLIPNRAGMGGSFINGVATGLAAAAAGATGTPVLARGGQETPGSPRLADFFTKLGDLPLPGLEYGAGPTKSEGPQAPHGIRPRGGRGGRPGGSGG